MRTAEHSARELGSRASRQRLPIHARPYFAHVQGGLSLGYRRGKTCGSWIARAYDPEHGYRFESLGKSNDLLEHVGLSFQQAQDASRLWYGQLASLDAGELTPGRCTVAMAMDDYLGYLKEKRKGKPQHRTKAMIKAHILPSLGKLELSKLTHSRLIAFRKSLAETPPRVRTRPGEPQNYRSMDDSDPLQVRARQATANRVLTVLKAALNYAKSETRRITTNAAWIDVKSFRNVDAPRIRFLTMDEVSSLIEACEPDFQKLAKSALLCGCRYGELTALTVKDFHQTDGNVYIAESKNGESRHVELNDAGITFFLEMTQGRSPNDIIFLRNGKAWKTSEQQRPMDAACKTTKIEGVTFHILRHTYASHSVMAGMPIDVLARNIGHKDTRITMRHYAHLSDDYRKRLIRANAPTYGFDSKPGPVLVTRAS